jgi:hypothetical protein
MKVHELIEALRKMDGETEVVVSGWPDDRPLRAAQPCPVEFHSEGVQVHPDGHHWAVVLFGGE